MQNTIIDEDIVMEIIFARKKDQSNDRMFRTAIANILGNISKENALAIVDFILNTKIEINLSDNHRRNYISLLFQLSKFYHNKKLFRDE